MTRSRAGTVRIPNRLMSEYYAQRSSAGLLITEATTISEEANGWNESPGIYTDEMTEGWKLTTEAVHEKSGVIFLQLWHMGRASHSSFYNGKPTVAPSAIKSTRNTTTRLRVNSPMKSPGRWKLRKSQESWVTINVPLNEHRLPGRADQSLRR
jgi:2,4-dienoyl-CoA reductase-like NADH-dependent reductase (Old Yellow Enzyme family)